MYFFIMNKEYDISFYETIKWLLNCLTLNSYIMTYNKHKKTENEISFLALDLMYSLISHLFTRSHTWILLCYVHLHWIWCVPENIWKFFDSAWQCKRFQSVVMHWNGRNNCAPHQNKQPHDFLTLLSRFSLLHQWC